MQNPHRARRWVRGLLLLTILLVVTAGVGGWLVLRRTVAPLDGQLRLAGLAAPVEILFDSQAIPHIYARDPDDAWLAVGYLHARERLWQMELYRRATGGRLSEIFGEATIPADERFVALGLRRAAAAEWQTATPRVRSALEHYAAGVNQAIAALGRWRRPPEFLLLGVTPEPWTPVDSLSVARLMAWRLAENRRGELVRGRLTQALGSAEASLLMGVSPQGAPTIIETGTSAASSALALEPGAPPDRASRGRAAAQPGTCCVADRTEVLPPGLEWLGLTARAGGSNSWVVRGTRTATGRPMLANDPHLAVEMPGIWYEVHVVAAGLDVAGVTLPSAPFVIIGHNGRMAWGLTNAGTDVIDFYAEDVDMATRRYLYRGEWVPLGVTKVQIGVRGRERPVDYEVFSTRHGPLVATERNWEDPPDLGAASGRVKPHPLALYWPSVTEGETAGAFEAVDRAGSWSEFVDAVRRFGAPAQNFVYADVDGHIGYALSGRLPIRPPGHDGGAPEPGWTGENEWRGTVPPDQMPAVLDPPSGEIVTANAEIDRRWPTVMTRDWAAPFRTERIVSLLGAKTGLDRADMAAIQQDVRAESAEPILRAVDAARASAAFEKAEPEARLGIERLRLWDRVVDGRPVVALYEAFVRALWRRAFADEIPQDVFVQFFEYGLSERYVGLYAIIDDPSSHWWNDIATVDRRETRDDIVLLAAADAIIGLRDKFGDESNWAWDRLHALRFTHALGRGGVLLNWFFSRGPEPMIGDSYTVRKASVDVRVPYGVVDIASYRQILDVGDWDRSWAVATTGQSGNAMSPHYFDQNELWRSGRYRPVAFSRAAVEKARASRLLLTP